MKQAATATEWLSRDPLPDAERSQGPNLYEYVKNDPSDLVDPLGLKEMGTVKEMGTGNFSVSRLTFVREKEGP